MRSAAVLTVAALLAAPVAFGGAAQAQEKYDARLKAIIAKYDRCIDTDNNNAAWAMCGGARMSADDALLNEAWRGAYASKEGAAKTALLAEQRLWNAFKEKSCAFWLEGYGREGQVLHFPICRGEVIEERIKRLALIEAFE